MITCPPISVYIKRAALGGAGFSCKRVVIGELVLDAETIPSLLGLAVVSTADNDQFTKVDVHLSLACSSFTIEGAA